MYLLGYDIGSSSVKAALVEFSTGVTLKVVQYPETEMEIISHESGWAEQHPDTWWQNVISATHQLFLKSGIDPAQVKAIGIAYQMHGLVCVDKDQNVLRPAIIWCDSRAVHIGHQALESIGQDYCFNNLLNSPGNFTASKLKWVKDNEPEVYDRIDKIMLPGDYIAMKLTGEINTTISGLSEGILWDFKNHGVSERLLDHYDLSKDLIPEIVDTFSVQGILSSSAANQLGLKEGTPVSYRAGDQPNNALSLGVLEPGEVAATGGTSGVVYGVVDEYISDPYSRINSFAHVNHYMAKKRIGMLLCINGAGIQYAWLKNQLGREGQNYEDMERMASKVPIGSEGLIILPFGNGAERMLNNANPGARILNLEFNRHKQAHLYRAALEGIAFSFIYGFRVLNKLGLNTKTIKVGSDNLFQSSVFSQTISNVLNVNIEVVNTTGAIGAAKGSGLGTGIYNDLKDVVKNNEAERIFTPGQDLDTFHQAYTKWEKELIQLISKSKS